MAAGTLRSFTGPMLSGLEKLQRPFIQEPPSQAATHISICTDTAAAPASGGEEEAAEEEGPTTVAERGAVWLCVQTTTHGGTMDKGYDAVAAAPVHRDVRTQDLANTATPVEIDDGYSEAADKFVPFTIRGFVAAVREADLRQTWPFTEGLLRWRTQCRGDQPGILPPLDSAITFNHTISSIRDHVSDTQILRSQELDSIAANAKESTEYTIDSFLYGTTAAVAPRKEEVAEGILTGLKGHNNLQEVEAEAEAEASSAFEKLQTVEVVHAFPSSSVAAACVETRAGNQPSSESAMRPRAHGGGSVGPVVGSEKSESQIGRFSSGAWVGHVLPEPTYHEARNGIVESDKATIETVVVQRKAETKRNSLRHLENGDCLPSEVEGTVIRGNERIEERAPCADKQSEHHGVDRSAISQGFAEGTMTSSVSDRPIDAELDDNTDAARERLQVEEPRTLVSGFKRQEAEEVPAGLRSLDPDEEDLEVEESGKLSTDLETDLETQAAESVIEHSAAGKNLADGSLVQCAAIQPPVRVAAIESRSQKTWQVVETARSPGIAVAGFPPGLISGGEERVCPVCRLFASPSNTALNVHIDQCLVNAPANSMDRLNRTQTLQQQQGRQQKFKVKTQKKRSLADLCALAPRRDLEDSGKSGSGSRESSPVAEQVEVAGRAVQRLPEIRRQPRTAFVRGEPPAAAAAATGRKKVRSGSTPITAGRFGGPTGGRHPGIRRTKKQRLSSDSADSSVPEKRPLSAIDQRDSDLQMNHKHRKLSGKHTVRANSSCSPTVSAGVKKTSPSFVALEKQNSTGSAGAHRGASSSSSLPELQLPSLKQTSKDTKVWSKDKPDCRKDPAKPVVVRGKGNLEGNASEEEEVHLDVVELVAQNEIERAVTTPSPNVLGDEPRLSPRPGVLGSDKGMGLDTSALQKIPSALERKKPLAPPASVGSMSKIAKIAENGTVVSSGAALSAHKARELGLSTSTTKSGNNNSSTAVTNENGSEPRPGSPVPVKRQDLVTSKSSLGICGEAEDHTREQLVNPANNNVTQCTAINSAPGINKTASIGGLKETMLVLEQQQETSLTINAAGEGTEGNMKQQPTGKGKKLSRKKGDPVGSLMKPVTNKSREPNTRKEKLKRKRPFLGYTEKEAPHLMSRSNAILREVLGLKQCFGEGGTPLACKPFVCRVASTPAEKLTTLQVENPAGEKSQLPDTSANVAPSLQRVDVVSKDTADVSAIVDGSGDPILESQNSGVHPRSEVDGCLIEKARKEKPKDCLQDFEEGEINDLNQAPDSRLQVPSSHPCSTESNPGGMTGKSLSQPTIDSQSKTPCELPDSQTPEDQGKDMRGATPVPTQSSPKRADWSPTLSHNTSKRKSLIKSVLRNTLGATNTKDAGEPARRPTVPPRGPGGRFISTKSLKEGGGNASGSSTKSNLEVLSSGNKSKLVHTLLSPPHRPESAGLCNGVPQIETLKTGPSTSIHSSISAVPAQAAGYPDSGHASDERLRDVAPITHETVEETTRRTSRGGSIEPIDTYTASSSPQQPNISALCGSKTPTDMFCHGAPPIPNNLPIIVRRSPVEVEQASQATGNQHSEKSPMVAVQAGAIAGLAPLQHSSTNSMTSPLVSGAIGTAASFSLTDGQTKAVVEVDSQVAKLPGWILAAITEQPPTAQTSQEAQALTYSRDFETSRASVSPVCEGISHGDPSIVRLFGNPVFRLMGKNVLVSNDDKEAFGHKQQTMEVSPVDRENIKELQAGKAVDVACTDCATAVHTGVGTAEAVLETSDATASVHVSGVPGWGPLKEVEMPDDNGASSQGNPMFSLVTALGAEAVNMELVVPWQAGDANQHVNNGSTKHSLDLQCEVSSAIRKGGLASDVEWQADNSLAGLDMTTNMGSFSTSLPGESRSPAALKIKRKSLSLNGRGTQPPPGQEVIIIDDLPGVYSPPEPTHRELTINALLQAGALRRLPPDLDAQASKCKAPGARGPVMELDRSRIPQLSGVSQSDLLVELRKLGLVPAMHMTPRSFTSPQVAEADHNSMNHKAIVPKHPHTITPPRIPDSPTISPSPRNLSPSAGGEALGLPPWLLAAKKQKEAQMATNLIVLDDDDPADEFPSSSCKISVHVPLGSPSPCSTSTSGGAARAHARHSTPSPVAPGIAPVTKFRGQGTTLLHSAVLRHAGGMTAPNTGVNLGSVGSGRSSSGMVSPRSGERGYRQESVGIVLPSPHLGDGSQILERREPVCVEKETSPVCKSHCKQIKQAGKLPHKQDKLVETVCEGNSRPRNESNLSGLSHSWISGINGGLKRGGAAQTHRAPAAFPTETDATHLTQLETLGLLDCLGIEQPLGGAHATKTSRVASQSSTATPRWEDIPRAAGDLRLQAESTAPPDSRSILFQHPISQRHPSHISGDLSVNSHNGSEHRDNTAVDSIRATAMSPNLARALSSHRIPVPSPGALLTDTRASMRSIEGPLRPAALGSLLERRNLPHMLERLVTSSDGSMSVEKGMAQTERQVLQNSVSRGEQQASPGIPSNMTTGTLFPEMVRNGDEAQFVKTPLITIPVVSNTIKRQSSLGRARQQPLSGTSSSRDVPDLMTMTPLGKQVARNAFYRENQPMDSIVAQASIDTRTGSDISGLCSMSRSQAESFSHTLTKQISAVSSVARQQEQVLSTNQLLRNQASSTQMFLDLEC